MKNAKLGNVPDKFEFRSDSSAFDLHARRNYGVNFTCFFPLFVITAFMFHVASMKSLIKVSFFHSVAFNFNNTHSSVYWWFSPRGVFVKAFTKFKYTTTAFDSRFENQRHYNENYSQHLCNLSHKILLISPKWGTNRNLKKIISKCLRLT